MKKNNRRKTWPGLTVLALALLVTYGWWALHRPLPALQPITKSSTLQFNTTPATLNWPTFGQSAAGIVGSKLISTQNAQKPVPTASTAKIITALTILKAKPLKLNQMGPIITLSSSDVALYQSYAAQDGSVVTVAAGEQISEYQMLQAMLLPSANNVADSLAIWAYGSLPAYKTAATAYLAQLGLKNTTIGEDASGFSPTTTSTAQDLVRLGDVAMQNPVLAQIVGQPMAANIPMAGTIKNINSLLGSNGIVGIKTGNNNQDPGVFLAAAQTTVYRKPVTVVTALMDAPGLFEAMKSSVPLIQSAEANFKPVTLLKAGSIVGNYRSPNGQSLPVETTRDLTLTTWSGSQLTGKLNLPTLDPNAKAGRTVNSLTVADPLTDYKVSVPLRLNASPAKPSVWHRLTHPK